MAKKEEPVSMVDTFAEFKELKNIEITTMISVLEESFRNVLAKMFGTDENFDIIVNPTKGDFEIWRNRELVEDGFLVGGSENRPRVRGWRGDDRRGAFREIRSSSYLELAPNAGFEDSRFAKRCHLQ